MNNEENKRFARFQFSTELDRGENKDSNVVMNNTTNVGEEAPKAEKKKRNKKIPENKKRAMKRQKKKANRNKNNDNNVVITNDNKPVMEEKKTIETTPVEVVEDVITNVPVTEPVAIYTDPIEELLPEEEIVLPKLEEEHESEGVISIPEEYVMPRPAEVTTPVEENIVVPTVEETIPQEEITEEKVEEVIPKEEIQEVVPETEPVTVPDFNVETTPVQENIPEPVLETGPVAEIPTVPETTPVVSTEPVALSPYEQEISSIKEKGINLPEARDINLDHTLYRDQYFIANPEDTTVQDVKEAINNSAPVDSGETHTIKKVYLSFQARVTLLIIGIIILFGAACFIIISTLNSNETKKIDFVEKTTIHYDVCDENSKCLKEGDVYKSDDASKVHIDYHYEALFDEAIDYDLNYHVEVVHKIFDQYDSNKVSYEDENKILDDKSVVKGTNPAVADVNVELDFQKYYNFVNEFKEEYSANAESIVTVILYMDDGNETRNVGEVDIPLSRKEFDVTRKEVNDSKQVYLLEVKDWTNTNTLYIVVGSIFVLLSLFLLFHLTRLSLAITGKKSKYQEYLMSILNEYDRLIVIARDGFETNVEKKIIKVYTFEELLDARSILNKPIIYSRINNVKSEFLVEDEEVIYKFVLKEADMGE